MPLLPLFPGVGGGAVMPDRRIEIAFTSGPNDTPVWTDVTTDVRELSTNRGRSQNLDRYEAGHMSVTLDNRARSYDPTTNTNVNPNKRIRFVADGQTQFDGWVDEWKLGYDGRNDAIVTIKATDHFRRLQRIELPSSPFAVEVLADGATTWWRLNEPVGSTMVFDSIGSRHATVGGTPTFAQGSLIAQESGTSITFDHADGDGATATGGRSVSTFPFTVEAWIKVPNTAGERRYIWADVWSGSYSDLASLNLSSNTGTSLGVPEGAVIFEATGRSVYSTTLVDDNAIHHIVGVAHTAFDFRIYVDGVEETNVLSGGTGSVSANSFSTALGNLTPNGNPLGAFGLGGQAQSIVVYNGTALSAARVLAHYNAGKAGGAWDGDSPGTRVGRILDHAGIRQADRDLDTGDSTLQEAKTNGITALEHCIKVGESEFGDLFVSRDGKVKLVARSNLINLDSAGTLDDSGTTLAYSDIGFDFSDQLIRNRVTIGRDGGVDRTLEDGDSIDTFGVISYSRTGLIHDSDVLSGNAAEFFLSEYGDPLLRVTEVTIKPQRSPGTLFPLILPRELGDYVTVKLTPPGGGSQIEQASRIEGISHYVTPKFWETRWQLSDAYAGTDFFELDDGTGSVPLGLGSSTSDGPALYFRRLKYVCVDGELSGALPRENPAGTRVLGVPRCARKPRVRRNVEW